jgi:MinD-like ATPase involved in chromosome partitioning or flagellar assembly
VDEIQFADGFDTPDRLAFGLGAAQLIVVVVAVLAGYVAVRSPLPLVVSMPLALMLVAVAACLGWLRIGGRPSLEWGTFACLYALRPHRGTFAIAPAERSAASTDAGVIPLFGAAGDSDTRGVASCPTAKSGGARRLIFFSLKGGTGRSTLATELACLLAAGSPDRDRQPMRVALLDLDLRSASVSVRLGAPHATVIDYALAAPDERRVLDFTLQHRSGAYVLLGPDKPVATEWPVNAALLREMLRELDMEGFDLVVMDVSPELSTLTSAALTTADDVFVVVTPTAGGIQDAYRTTESLRQMGLRHQLRYVINRTRPGTDIAEPMADLRGQVIAEIPDDDLVIAAENRHQLVALGGTGPAADALHRLARRVGRELRFPYAS